MGKENVEEKKKREQAERAKKEQHDRDTWELGSVEHVDDLQPDSQVGASRKAATQERILAPNSTGYFEAEAGSVGGLGAPLHLGHNLKKDGGPAIAEYEAGYNMYSVPLRSTLRALGRVKDVSMTGAPMTPAELKKRPDLNKRFQKLSLSHGNIDADRSYADWARQQTNMKIDIEVFGAGQHELAAAISDYRSAQKLLEQKRTEAKKAARTQELHDIDETAETLSRIVEVSLEGWNAIAEIDAQVNKTQGLNENADGGNSQGLPQSNNVDFAYGTDTNPTGVGPAPKSKRQVVGGTGQDLLDAGSAGSKIANNVKKQLEKSGKLSLGLKDVFIAATGNAKKYSDLQRDIALLEGKIAKLKLEQEFEHVRAATQRLNGFSMEFRARTHQVQADRSAARNDARMFAKAIGSGDEGIMAMYAAEAYQELAQFGELASAQRKSAVDPLWGRVHGYLHGNDPHRYAAIGAADDAVALDTNLRAVQEQRAYFGAHVPEWKQVAHQWSEFLRERANLPLITETSDADRDSKAP